MVLSFWNIVIAVVVGCAIWDGIKFVAVFILKMIGWD